MRPTVLNFSEPMKQLEALVLQGKLRHDANPAMDWMMSNVVCHRDAKDNIYPRKERNEAKIDGPVAAIMGLGRAMASVKPDVMPQITVLGMEAL
jgi:phage terminase large subunit-like protein